PVAALEPRLLQRGRELARPAHRLAVVGAMEALVGEPRDDLAPAEEQLRPAQQVRQREREVHHQPVHAAHSPTWEGRRHDGMAWATESSVRSAALELFPIAVHNQLLRLPAWSGPRSTRM